MKCLYKRPVCLLAGLLLLVVAGCASRVIVKLGGKLDEQKSFTLGVEVDSTGLLASTNGNARK